MISADTPILLSKACELFILELTLRSWLQTQECKRQMLQRFDIARAIRLVDTLDFLVELVSFDHHNKVLLLVLFFKYLSFQNGVSLLIQCSLKGEVTFCSGDLYQDDETGNCGEDVEPLSAVQVPVPMIDINEVRGMNLAVVVSFARKYKQFPVLVSECMKLYVVSGFFFIFFSGSGIDRSRNCSIIHEENIKISC